MLADIVPEKKKGKRRDFVVLPSTIIGEHLIHPSTIVRSSAFSVLVLSLSSTRPYPLNSLEAIKENLAILHTDTDAKFRNELFANTKYMLERLKGATSLLTREIIFLDTQKPAETAGPVTNEVKEDVRARLEQHLKEHKSFLQWYLSFLAKELVPTASYQRHTTALKAIEIALKTGLQECQTASTTPTPGPDQSWRKQEVFTQTMVRLLLDLLLDPFEEVRNCSLAVLKYAPRACFGKAIQTEHGDVPKLLFELAAKAKDASARTGRADFADGLAYTYVLQFRFFETAEQRHALFRGLLDAVEADIVTASEDLEKAAHVAPVHGQFATIRQLWDLMSTPAESEYEIMQQLQERLVKSCLDSWNTVKDILCNDSPEGHVLPGSNPSNDVDIKSILSYCFRACHESSLLVQALVRKLSMKTANGQPFLPFSSFEMLGNLTFEELSTLRHRGAFSTVSLTFTQVCRATQTPSIIQDGGSALLESWYQGALACIAEQNSTTRRSAGIPALITGILSASSKELTFDAIMNKLQAMARAPVFDTGKDEVQLSQVHAMNSLKDIFKSATLGKKADSYITNCFQIAADSMKSNIWAISNCGLLLVKALIDCMLGTSESKATAEAGWDGRSIRISYDRYPTLPDLLLRLLGTDINYSVEAKEVFPALEFLRRVGPPEDHTMLREQFFAGVVIHLDSETWDVRDLAARTACTFLLNDNWKVVIDDLLQFFRTGTNGLHGVILLIKYLLRRRRDLAIPTKTAQLEALYKDIKSASRLNSTNPTDAIIHAAFQEALAAIAALDPEASIDAGQLVPGSLLSRAPPQVLADICALPIASQRRNPTLTARVSDAKARVTNIVQSMTADNATVYVKLVNSTQFTVDSDEDVVVAMLDMLRSDSASEALVDHDVVQNVMCMTQFLRNPWPARVQTAATETIANLLHRIAFEKLSKKQVEAMNAELVTPSFLDFSTKHLERRNSVVVKVVNGPELTNAMLHVKGGALRLAAPCVFGNTEIKDEDLRQFVRRVRMFAQEISWALNNEDVDFYAREAALLAADAFYAHNTSTDKRFSINSPFMLGLLQPLNLAILSALSDDDDEIRDLAAKVVGRLSKKRCVPEAALAVWTKWLVEHYATPWAEDADNSSFADEVTLRVMHPRTRYSPLPEWASMSVREELGRALVEDNALFVEESQNLYIDEVVQTQTWLAFFDQLDDTSRTKAAKVIGSWALGGLETLVERCQANYDGPFGWTSKVEVFHLVMRVILASRKVVEVLRNGSELSDEMNTLCDDLEFQSEMLDIRGGKNGLHPLLLDELEWVVQEVECGLGGEEDDEEGEGSEGEEFDFDGENFDEDFDMDALMASRS